MKIAASILAADFTDLRGQVAKVERAGADWIHVDVMDGHYVPNLTFGPVIVDALNRLTELPLDVHLMIEEPERYLPQFREAGADILTVHVEVCRHLHRTLHMIQELGAKAGVALNPATPASFVEEALQEADLVLAMTVNPGFAGQEFIRTVLPKIASLRRQIDARGREVDLEVDGGIDPVTAPEVVRAGASVLVAATAIFHAPDIEEAVRELRRPSKNCKNNS